MNNHHQPSEPIQVMPQFCDASGEGPYGSAYDVNGDWSYDQSSLVSLALFGHTVGTKTLSSAARRRTLNPPHLVWDADGTVDEAFDALTTSFASCLTGASAIQLPLSAGYDSRLLLALCLRFGITPEVSVMGSERSTDVMVASEICGRLGIPIAVTQIRPDDYLKAGPEIAKVTSGEKLAAHWHTYLYARDAFRGDAVQLVGSNGEFARSYYFDHPRLNAVVDRMAASTLPAYWLTKFARRVHKFSRHNPIVRGKQQGAMKLAATPISSRWGAKTLPSALDAFYVEHRVQHFIGSGVACYAAFGKPRSPFLDGGWIRSVAALPRALKRQNRYHLECIKRLYPDLLDVPFNQHPGGGREVAYDAFEQVSRFTETVDIIQDSKHLDRWATRDARSAILRDDRCQQIAERSFWLSLHFAEVARAAGKVGSSA